MVRKLLVSLALVSTCLAGTAQAVQFNLNSTGAGTAIGTQARRGFEVATGYWASVLTNNVTVNLDIGYSTLGTGILGSTGSSTAAVFNSAVYSALASNVTSSVDASAVSSLRPLSSAGGLSVVTNAFNASGTGYVDTATRVDNDNSFNNRGTSMNTSVAKALGITTNYLGAAINPAARDGTITFSDAFKFDFDPSDGID